MAPEVDLLAPKKSAHTRQMILLSMGFFVVCAVVAVIAFRDQLHAAVAQVTDRSPPQATLSFRTANGRVSQGSITVQPGEVFVPLILVRDNVDPAPVARMWLSPVNGDSSQADGRLDQAVAPGDRVVLAEPGLWHIHARVADQSGNAATYSAVISVFNSPTTISTSKPDRQVLGESEGTAVVGPGGVSVTGGVLEATSVGVAATIEELKLIEDRQGLRSLDVTVVIGANHDLVQLDRSHVSLFPLDDMKRPIPQSDWKLIPESEAEYLAGKNIWRMRFKWEYDGPLPRKPASLRISFAIGAGDRRRHFFADTDGISAVPDAIGSLDATLFAGD